MTSRLDRAQWRIVILGWFTYASFYLTRLNLATALPAMQAEFHWSPEQTGLLAGAMLWTYAAGQFINGWLGDRVNTRSFVFAGLVGSIILNILVSTTSSLTVMVVLWVINGYFQSMGWGPILRTLSNNLTRPQSQRISGVFGTCYIFGNVATWALTGWLLHIGNWRGVFLVPALLTVFPASCWYLFNRPALRPVESDREKITDVVPTIREIWPTLLVATCAGILLNTVLSFAPTYFVQTQQLEFDQAALASIGFPIAGLIGTALLSTWVLNRMRGNTFRSLIILLAISSLARGLYFILPNTPVMALGVLMLMGITAYALSNLLVTTMPLSAYPHLGSSLVAGLMDAAHSLGGAFGGVIIGTLLSLGKWPTVFGFWTVLPLFAMGFLGGVMIRQRVDSTENAV